MDGASVASSRRVLIVADGNGSARTAAVELERLGCEVETHHNGSSGRTRALDGTIWDLVLLERRLPGLDGLDLCRVLSASAGYPAILLLGNGHAEHDSVVGLEAGADDYLSMPFSVAEFKARVRAIFRRVRRDSGETSVRRVTVEAGEVQLNLESRTATRSGRLLDLTAKEFDLLAHLMHHPCRAFTRAQLLDQVWGASHDSFEHTVSSHINRLRAKLEPDPTRPRYIVTVWGVGYRFLASRESSVRNAH